jgi:hypothetical protein
VTLRDSVFIFFFYLGVATSSYYGDQLCQVISKKFSGVKNAGGFNQIKMNINKKGLFL